MALSANTSLTLADDDTHARPRRKRRGPSHFGPVLRAARDAAKPDPKRGERGRRLSQEQLGRRVEPHALRRSQIGAYETGLKVPSMQQAAALAQALEIPPWRFYEALTRDQTAVPGVPPGAQVANTEGGIGLHMMATESLGGEQYGRTWVQLLRGNVAASPELLAALAAYPKG